MKLQIIYDLTANKIVSFYISNGTTHDFKMFKESSPRFQEFVKGLADSGYQGILKVWHTIEIPHKKPRAVEEMVESLSSLAEMNGDIHLKLAIKALSEIQRNQWFRMAINIGFALGDNADVEMLSSIAGNREAVVRPTDFRHFQRLIRLEEVTMPGMGPLEPIPKRDMHVFYVLDTSSEERDFQDLRYVLLYMRRKFGLEVFRNPLWMASILTDLSPALRRDANILRRLGDAGLLAELEQADSRNWARVIAKTRYWMENEWFMREEQAAYYAQALEILYHPENNVSAIPKSPKIEKLNRLVNETLEILSSGNKAQIAVLEFDSKCRWLTPNGLEDLQEGFQYECLELGGRESNLGAALRELNSKMSNCALSRSAFHSDTPPFIIFITDGHATDDYEDTLKEIRNKSFFESRCFRGSTKIAFALGGNADLKTLSSLVDYEKAVIQTDDMQMFRHLIYALPWPRGLYDDILPDHSFKHQGRLAQAGIIPYTDEIHKWKENIRRYGDARDPMILMRKVEPISDTSYAKEPEPVHDADDLDDDDDWW